MKKTSYTENICKKVFNYMYYQSEKSLLAQLFSYRFWSADTSKGVSCVSEIKLVTYNISA